MNSQEGNREWGVGSGEWEDESHHISSSHSPLPIPYSPPGCYVNYS